MAKMYGIFHIRPVSVGLDNQIYNVQKISEIMDLMLVGPLLDRKFINELLIKTLKSWSGAVYSIVQSIWPVFGELWPIFVHQDH